MICYGCFSHLLVIWAIFPITHIHHQDQNHYNVLHSNLFEIKSLDPLVRGEPHTKNKVDWSNTFWSFVLQTIPTQKDCCDSGKPCTHKIVTLFTMLFTVMEYTQMCLESICNSNRWQETPERTHLGSKPFETALVITCITYTCSILFSAALWLAKTLIENPFKQRTTLKTLLTTDPGSPPSAKTTPSRASSRYWCQQDGCATGRLVNNTPRRPSHRGCLNISSPHFSGLRRVQTYVKEWKNILTVTSLVDFPQCSFASLDYISVLWIPFTRCTLHLIVVVAILMWLPFHVVCGSSRFKGKCLIRIFSFHT